MLLSYDRALCDADDTMLCEQLGCTAEELSETVSSLREKGLVEGAKKLAPSASNKNLTGKEIAGAIESDNSLKQLIEECEAICGKVFTSTDISKIVSLNTTLGLDSETILLLFYYHFEKLDAVGKKLTVSYVEKSAYSLYNQEIRTLDALQSYIKENEKRNSNKYKLSRMFGIGDRSFTKKEEKFFDKWLVEWEMPFELVEAAFEIAVDNTGKAGLEYMSKILSDWHDSGIRTVEQAEKANADFRAANKNKQKFVEKPSTNGASFDTEEFFEKARKRSEAMMNAIAYGEGDK
jgi:DnaD/phage-associated family protein